MPFLTEARIEELCSRIRVLCRQPFSAETETELRKLARELRLAIQQHVGMAKSSLSTKRTAIIERDPDQAEEAQK